MILNEVVSRTLKNTIETVNLFGIESFIVEQDLIRGINESHEVAIITPSSNEMECEAIAINRLDVLTKRMKLLDENSVIEYTVNGRDCNTLTVKSKKLKVEYKCANSSAIRAPKELGVSELYEVSIPDGLHDILNKSKSAMNADSVSILVDDGVLTYKFLDDNNDQLLYQDGDIVSLYGDDDISFVHRYSIKHLLKALNKCDEPKFTVLEKGVLKFKINSQIVYILTKKS